METTSVVCDSCGKTIVRDPKSCSTGYGADAQGHKHCFECCAANDRKHMSDGKPIALYLTRKQGTNLAELTNWPGTLHIPIGHVREGRHNMAGRRYDLWFTFEGHKWHGTQIGDNTQVCRCRTVKSF